MFGGKHISAVRHGVVGRKLDITRMMTVESTVNGRMAGDRIFERQEHGYISDYGNKAK